MTDRNLHEKQARPRVDASRELASVVTHYRSQNDRFEKWLNERDAAQRQRTTARLANVEGRGEARAR